MEEFLPRFLYSTASRGNVQHNSDAAWMIMLANWKDSLSEEHFLFMSCVPNPTAAKAGAEGAVLHKEEETSTQYGPSDCKLVNKEDDEKVESFLCNKAPQNYIPRYRRRHLGFLCTTFIICSAKNTNVENQRLSKSIVIILSKFRANRANALRSESAD